MAIVATPVAVVAAASAERAWERGGAHSRSRTAKLLPVAPAVAAVVPLAALGGRAAGGAALAVGIAALVVGAVIAPAPVPLVRRVVVTVAPAVAAAALVVAVQQDVDAGMVLVVGVLMYDFACYMFGRGPTGGVLGVGAGVLTLAALAVFVAAVLVPPFGGRSPWIIVGLLAVLAPAGVILLRWLAPARLPALLRLDSLFLAGPAWVAAVAVLLHR